MHYIKYNSLVTFDGFRLINIYDNRIEIKSFLIPEFFEGQGVSIRGRTPTTAPKFVIDAYFQSGDYETPLKFYEYESHSIHLADFINTTDFSENSIYLMYAKYSSGVFKGYFNILATSSYSKTNIQNIRGCVNTNIIPIAYICTRSKTDNFLNMDFVFFQNKFFPSKTNFDDVCVEIESLYDKHGNLSFDKFPKLSMSIIEKTADYLTVELSASYKGAEYDKELAVYVDNEAGYLPKKKLVFKGKTRFKLYFTGLDTGDSIVIRAGYKHWKNIVKVETNV